MVDVMVLPAFEDELEQDETLFLARFDDEDADEEKGWDDGDDWDEEEDDWDDDEDEDWDEDEDDDWDEDEDWEDEDEE